jgi:multidrug resistance efflux pump
VSVSSVQLDAELHAAERALEAATERHRAAEHALWGVVSRSGHDPVSAEEVQAARAEVAEANRVHAEAEALVADLRGRHHQAEERERQLLAVTDMLIARDDARRNGKMTPVGPVANPRHRSLLQRLLRR